MTAKELLAARAFRWCLLATGLLAVLAMAVLGYLRWRPVAAAPGWQYTVLVDDVEMIDSLAVSPAGELLGTTQHNHGKGELVRFDRNWQVTTLLSGLSKPAGLLPWRDGVLIAQEEQNMWVMYWTPSGARPLFRSDYAEGITKLSNGNIVILADRKNGELTEFNPDTGSSRILLSGLDKGEGLCAMRDGRIYFTEK